MKLSLVFVLCFAIWASAQQYAVDKNAMLVKGAFSYSSQTDSRYDHGTEAYIQTDVHASYQYFFIKNAFFGVVIRYNTDSFDLNTSSSFSYGVQWMGFWQ